MIAFSPYGLGRESLLILYNAILSNGIFAISSVNSLQITVYCESVL